MYVHMMATCDEPYKYSKIKNVSIGSVCNIYGVIKSFTGPNISKSGWNVLSMWLVDESCAEEQWQRDCLPCVLFGSDTVKLPDIAVGDIVRFHRLKISYYNGWAQGKEGPGFSWLVASEDSISHSHDNVTFTQADEKRICALKDWRAKSSLFTHNTDITRISDIEHKDYWVDLSVQVVAIYQSESDTSCTILVAWDGTLPSFKSHSYCTIDRRIGETDKNLETMSSSKTVKIHCYDNHKDDACKFVSGQLVELVNVHVKVIDSFHTNAAVSMGIIDIKELESSTVWLSLVMHKGNTNGRRIVALQETDNEYKELTNLLLETADNEESQSILRATADNEESQPILPATADNEESQSLLQASCSAPIHVMNDSESDQDICDNKEEMIAQFADDILALTKANQFFMMYPHIERDVLLSQKGKDLLSCNSNED